MKIDKEKLDEFIEEHIRPLWEEQDSDNPYRDGGGEVYLHDEILAKAQPLMALESIKDDPRGSLHGALKAHDNLLSQFEWSRAKDFILNVSEKELLEYLLHLLDGSIDFQERLTKFLEWSKASPSPSSKNKVEINPTVCSYFLAMHDPVQYAFCKPMTYQALAKLLIVDEGPVNEPVQRIIQCTDFYKAVLHDLKERYGLQNGNLLDIHSLAYTYKELSSNADPHPSSNDKEKNLIEKIRQSGDYKEFIETQLKPKIDRERRAWELLEKHRGEYTQEALNEIFDTVDLNPKNVRWFGSLVAHPNRNLIFASSTDKLNGWFEKLLFSNLPVEKALDDCLGEGKIKGASNGLATLLLYLKNPDENVIWVPATEKGLTTLERLKPAKAASAGQRYLLFSEEAIDFRKRHQIGGQELDWHLSYISKHFENINDDANTIRYWTYSPGRDAKYWEHHYSNGIMTIGWDFLGDLTQIDDKETIRLKMQTEYGDSSSHMNRVLACYDFAHVIQPGDIILAKKGKSQLLGYGKVQSDYFFDDNRAEHKHVRKVKWIKKGVWDTSNNQMALKTLTDISSYPDFVKKLKSLIGSVPSPATLLPVYDKEKELNDLFLDEAKFDQIIEIMKSKKNIVLQGPPGVGKTFIARHLSYALMGLVDKDRVAMIQFHQSYSYEDFMQGFRPNSEGKFDLKNGVFYEFCRKAQQDPDNPHVFIIDEINRGNLSKIFGEMFMLVEGDKRGPDFAMPLTYAQSLDDTFYIPDNIYIIGTMNTADRSLALVDYALRRRFGFITLNPGFENHKFKKYLIDHGVEASIVEKVIDRMMQLNNRIAEDHKNLGRGYCIGHSYFCPVNNNQIYDGTWFENVVRTEIEPLLEEYWFDDPDKVQKRVDLLLA